MCIKWYKESILPDTFTISEKKELAIDSKVSNEKKIVSDISNKEDVTICLLNESVRNNL